MATWTAEVFENEYLDAGATDVHAIVTVTCKDAGQAGAGAPGGAAEVIIVDCSGSMSSPSTKIVAARSAAAAAVGEIADGTWFSVIAGTGAATPVYPNYQGMVQANATTRSEAQAAVQGLKADGGTAISNWLRAADALFGSVAATQCHAILLTDGKDEGETPARLHAVISAVTGKFQCDCRGVGADWDVSELRAISTALLGTVDLIADPAQMAADFQNIMKTAMGRGVADAQLRIWAPQDASVLFVRQVAPTIDELTDRRVPVSALLSDFPTGSWGDESRDYHVAVRVPPKALGAEQLVARVQLMVNGQMVAQGLVRATWSDDSGLTTRINPAVAHYTGQTELAAAIQDGLAAKASGDDATATLKLGRAAQLAAQTQNEDATAKLKKVVDIDDEATGTVRLKRDVSKLDEMALDTSSTKTTPGPLMASICPEGHQSSTDDFCDVCGTPIAPAGAGSGSGVAAAAPTLSAPVAASPAPPPAATGISIGAPAAPPKPCPNCQANNLADALFCEECGYDFTTGQLPPPPDPNAPPAVSIVTPLVAPAPTLTGVEWVAEVWVDPGWFTAQQADGTCPESRAPTTVPIRATTAMIGRHSNSQRVAPDIEVARDVAISHRHAQLTLEGDRWSIEDLGSTNGTFIGGPDGTYPTDPLPADQRHELAPDDRIYVGAWTRIVVRAATDDEKAAPAAVTHASRDEERRYEQLSPFELKTRLLSIASVSQGTGPDAKSPPLLDAGRGNPNWVATGPREAFFLLGTFALGESRRVWSAPGIGGMPAPAGIADRLSAFLSAAPDAPGAALFGSIVDYGIGAGFEPDPWVHELTSGIIGDHYPGPDRMNVYAEQIVHRYLDTELCADDIEDGDFDLFAVEGGTTAMCYIFDSLTTNRVLRRGDRVALMVPTFTPYLEIPRLERYGFDIVEIRADACASDGSPTWQCPPEELARLADPSVKALFVVNPSNPASVMLSGESVDAIVAIVAGPNPDLIVVTDDVYGTFVPGFRSLMASLPHNVIGVYSFSKYFGCTGWRLGVVAMGRHNVVDRLLTRLSEADRVELARRYQTITLDPAGFRFIDRMVADSRQVALNHTAGLSLPQQVQMTLFAASALVDVQDEYQQATRAIVTARLAKLYQGMELPLPVDPLRAGYYAEVDLMAWAEQRYGPTFAEWLAANYEPVDPVFRLAEQTHIVLLPGGGFDGPKWSVRVSLANLPEGAYDDIGAGLRAVFDQYVTEWQAS